jgi:hypothetical protein
MRDDQAATRASLDLTAGEAAVLQAYDDLIAVLREHGDDLPPFAHRNAIKAAASLWQVANGLGAEPGHPNELGL